MAMRETGSVGFERPFEYVREIRPLHFPVEAEVPESLPHLEQRTALYQLLKFHLRGRATVGSDQFVYYDASNPKACLAPDVYIKLGPGQSDIESWKTWERGTPELAIEIASRSDLPDEPWEGKLARYHRLGLRELVRFDARGAQALRVWDYVDGDLAERKIEPGAAAPCSVLNLWWVVVPHEQWGSLLRLSHDAAGQHLVKSELETEAAARQREAEARQQEAEARRQEAEARRAAEADKREAEARVRELEAELQRLREQKSS